MAQEQSSRVDAQRIGTEIGIDFSVVRLEEFSRGLEVELEHGPHDPETDVTHGDVLKTGKIAWAHLKELPDYYSRLDRMFEEAQSKH